MVDPVFIVASGSWGNDDDPLDANLTVAVGFGERQPPFVQDAQL
jgi:hypothetical protein